MISVNTDSQSGEPPPLSLATVTSLVRSALTEYKITIGRVNVVFSDDKQLRQLSRQFLDKDHYTDVIAFNLNEAEEPLDGEIYISQERALENSRTYNEHYLKELMRLVIHGSLHLAGCNDDTPSKQAGMRTLEERILASSSLLDHERSIN